MALDKLNVWTTAIHVLVKHVKWGLLQQKASGLGCLKAMKQVFVNHQAQDAKIDALLIAS